MAIKVVLLAEFLAIVVTMLTRARYTSSVLAEFVSVSLFLQWIALTSVAALCVLRNRLNALSPNAALGVAYLTLLLIVVLVTESSMWMLYHTGHLATPRPEWYGRFHLQNLIVGVVVNALLLRYLLALHQLRRRTFSEAQLQSQVRRYRVRPHFMFNALNNIAGLMRRRPAVAEAATEQLADLVRMMLDDSQETVSLSNEIAHAEKYLALESLRLDERLRVNWQLGSIPAGIRTPAQMLQLLLEYTIAHGVEPLPDGGEISVNIGVVEKQVLVDIECNAGAGVTEPSVTSVKTNVKVSETARKNAKTSATSKKLNAGKMNVGSTFGTAKFGKVSMHSMRQARSDSTNSSARSNARPNARYNARSDVMDKTKDDDPAAFDVTSESMFNEQTLDTTTLVNINLRLQQLYGEDGVLTTTTGDDMGDRLQLKVRHPAQGASL